MDFDGWSIEFDGFRWRGRPNGGFLIGGVSKFIDFDACSFQMMDFDGWSVEVDRFPCLERRNEWISMGGVSKLMDFDAWSVEIDGF